MSRRDISDNYRFFVVIITLLSIEVQLRKGYKQNEEVIELLKQIKEKHRLTPSINRVSKKGLHSCSSIGVVEFSNLF